MNKLLTVLSSDEIYRCVLSTSKILNLNKQHVLELLDESPEYDGIKRYIKNYEQMLNHPSRNLMGLSGPHTFTFFNNIMGKKILLLGETHVVRLLCNPKTLKQQNIFEVQDWFVQISKNSPSCIDIFTESPYKQDLNSSLECKSKTIKGYKSPLDAVICKMDNLQKTNNLPKYLRYHNIDTRGYGGYSSMILLDFHFRDHKMPKLSQKAQVQIEQSKKTILSYLLSIDTSKHPQLVYRNYIKYMLKLVGHNFNILDVNEMDEWENRYFKYINKGLSKMDKDIDKTRFLNVLLEIYMEEFDIYTSLLNIPMDLYCLIRLFIKFDETKLKRGPQSCDNLSINNVIIYTGDNHARLYRLFLEKYFNTQPKLTIQNKKTQCILLNNKFDLFTS